eukprot:TRINITY_DN10824_c0_g1_i1.p1 TRINITY_DN10824_c0_g1~~TRINITY_DN10824_c0_g1_i1.p1  ORF type:complete len:369 (+),score=71.92 TRINITY_DN10824_c0_g1_i1:98-1204(+)
MGKIGQLMITAVITQCPRLGRARDAWLSLMEEVKLEGKERPSLELMPCLSAVFDELITPRPRVTEDEHNEIQQKAMLEIIGFLEKLIGQQDDLQEFLAQSMQRFGSFIELLSFFLENFKLNQVGLRTFKPKFLGLIETFFQHFVKKHEVIKGQDEKVGPLVFAQQVGLIDFFAEAYVKKWINFESTSIKKMKHFLGLSKELEEVLKGYMLFSTKESIKDKTIVSNIEKVQEIELNLRELRMIRQFYWNYSLNDILHAFKRLEMLHDEHEEIFDDNEDLYEILAETAESYWKLLATLFERASFSQMIAIFEGVVDSFEKGGAKRFDSKFLKKGTIKSCVHTWRKYLVANLDARSANEVRQMATFLLHQL